ncbi:MAG: FtsX-like permease family protein, partial [Clostridia bacterium]|nr:FtsX-like permease family protein [Clostridia bacterium]
PEIILADEPTGALDTETSIQILDLLKEVARDRLVIMVTHNPDLAEKYSTRIINLLDGEKTGDTNPFTESAEENTEQAVLGEPIHPDNKKSKKEKGKAAMKFGTAFGLSFSNLLTKKGRTTLTAIAGSIGIIGIALVLAVSTGFSGYIKKLQADTLSTYPLTISESTIDLEDFQNLTNRVITDEEKAQKLTEKVYSRELFGDLTNMLKSNRLTDDYIEYIEQYTAQKNEAAARTQEEWAYCVQYGYGMDVNDYIFSNIGYNFENSGEAKYNVMSVNTLVQAMLDWFEKGMAQAEMNISASFVRSYIPTMCEIPESTKLVGSQYELLTGEWATEKDELLLVVDKYNRVSDITLALLGFKTIEGVDGYNVDFDDVKEFTFEEVKNKEFYYVDNTERYSRIGTNFLSKIYAPDADSATPPYITEVPSSAMTMKITGIVRLKEGVQQGVLQTGLAYTSAFVKHLLSDTDNINSPIVAAANADENQTKSVQVINPLIPSSPVKYTLRALAGDDTVSRISIYSKGYEEKEAIKTHLDAWNDDEMHPDEEDKVHYSDSTAMLFAALNSIVDAVKIVLIAFTAISLVVSSIMIGIITYVSVVERTKEIGVLRSIGARKKDISRIFNAETFLIGLFAGLLGVAVSYLLTIPINLIIGSFIENAGAIAALRVSDATVLVIVSFALTLIAGVIPARIAANKDPVVALRTE